tara:strand:- start:20642 stop:20902 length:261 start_codon:yes stop_codon:yes gene_type:complete
MVLIYYLVYFSYIISTKIFLYNIMVHLSNQTTIGIMVFYSILTFFLGPLITRPFMKDHPDQCVAGFLLGFTISIFLWMKFGRHYAK